MIRVAVISAARGSVLASATFDGSGSSNDFDSGQGIAWAKTATSTWPACCARRDWKTLEPGKIELSKR
jgi:hypothetical protein